MGPAICKCTTTVVPVMYMYIALNLHRLFSTYIHNIIHVGLLLYEGTNVSQHWRQGCLSYVYMYLCYNSLVVVEVDLTAAHFQPGKPNYEHVKWSLEERLGEDIRFVLCHSLTGISTINVVGVWCKP